MCRKESRHFNISVEGECEQLYFMHLKGLINNSDTNTYKLSLNVKVGSPFECVKRIAPRIMDKNNKKDIPYFHIQDIEDYYDVAQRNKFFAIIKEMKSVKKEFGIKYELGYSNYTFELWMLLHVTDMTSPVQSRGLYLDSINKYFKCNYEGIGEFKNNVEFQKILDKFVTLDSVRQAICRAKKIVQNNSCNLKETDRWGGITFFKDNPDLSVHKVVETILNVCGVK